MLRSSRTPVTRPRRLDADAYARQFPRQLGLVDQWLHCVYQQASTSGYPFIRGGSVPMLDYGPHTVICQVERVVHIPVEEPDSFFTESNRYELYLRTKSFVLRDTPFALHTSSHILLETYVGSPEERGAPQWTGLEYNLFEFVQTQADLSNFLEEFGRMENSQFVIASVGEHLHYYRASMPTNGRRIFGDSSNTS